MGKIIEMLQKLEQDLALVAQLASELKTGLAEVEVRLAALEKPAKEPIPAVEPPTPPSHEV